MRQRKKVTDWAFRLGKREQFLWITDGHSLTEKFRCRISEKLIFLLCNERKELIYMQKRLRRCKLTSIFIIKYRIVDDSFVKLYWKSCRDLSDE